MSIFDNPRTTPPPPFWARDFGRWSDKVEWPTDGTEAFERMSRRSDASPSRSDTSSFKDTNKERRSIFVSRAYRAVSEEPPVAVAAMAYRVQLEADRRGKGRPGRLLQAETRLRKRIKRALLDTTPGQPFP